MISFPVLGIYPPSLLLSKKKHPIFRRCAQATSNTTLQDFPLRQNQEKWISATEFQKLKTYHATWPEVETLEIFAGLTGAREQCLITNKAYKKLVDLCNSSFLTEAWGSRCCVMAMQNNLVDFHLASPTWRIMEPLLNLPQQFANLYQEKPKLKLQILLLKRTGKHEQSWRLETWRTHSSEPRDHPFLLRAFIQKPMYSEHL